MLIEPHCKGDTLFGVIYEDTNAGESVIFECEDSDGIISRRCSLGRVPYWLPIESKCGKLLI